MICDAKFETRHATAHTRHQPKVKPFERRAHVYAQVSSRKKLINSQSFSSYPLRHIHWSIFYSFLYFIYIIILYSIIIIFFLYFYCRYGL